MFNTGLIVNYNSDMGTIIRVLTKVNHGIVKQNNTKLKLK